MDTVADTFTPEDYAFYDQVFNLQPTNDELHYLAEAKRKLKSREDYYAHSDLLDYLKEDMQEMQGFFSFLSRPSFNFRHIFDACVNFLIDSKEPREKNEGYG